MSKPEPMTLFVGKQAKFQCVITGSAPMNVAWYKDNIAILPNEHYKVSFEKNKHCLEITNLEQSDQGTYLCKASNAVGMATCCTEIKVIDKPIFVKNFESTSIAVGNPLRLECQVNEDTGVSITWTRDGKKLHNTMDSKISFEEKVVSLDIPKSKIKDTGTYVCTAANDAGSSSCSSVVTVKGKIIDLNFLCFEQEKKAKAKSLLVKPSSHDDPCTSSFSHVLLHVLYVLELCELSCSVQLIYSELHFLRTAGIC